MMECLAEAKVGLPFQVATWALANAPINSDTPTLFHHPGLPRKDLKQRGTHSGATLPQQQNAASDE